MLGGGQWGSVGVSEDQWGLVVVSGGWCAMYLHPLFSNNLFNLKLNDCNSDIPARIFSPQAYGVVSSA